MSGYLTTHVLDTAGGRPAAGMTLELFALEDGQRRLVASAVTDDDGRTDGPLLGQGRFGAGIYEIVFDVAGYFAGRADLPDPPFLDLVTVRFGVADAESHYHVPLLVSPWSYSTYRG